jgi:hypothetical protein
MRLISGTTAMLTLRGKIPVTMIVALGALLRQRSSNAFNPRVMSATFSSLPSRAPTLFVPARITMTFGLTPSNSPFSIRHSMCSILSAPQPKSAAFHPKKFVFQLARKSGNRLRPSGA